MRNQAIINDIEKRVQEMSNFNYHNPQRIATIQLLDEIANTIDFQQKQVNYAYKSIEWYNQQFGMKATTKLRFDNWQIKKAALTRLQSRYKKTLEILTTTI
jgi:predicted AlkP superfamily phosphohydrolase/phosphomutase